MKTHSVAKKRGAGSDRHRLFGPSTNEVEEEPPLPDGEESLRPPPSVPRDDRRFAAPALAARAARHHADADVSDDDGAAAAAAEQNRRGRGDGQAEAVAVSATSALPLEVTVAVAEETDAVKRERMWLGLCPGCGVQLFDIRREVAGSFWNRRQAYVTYVPLMVAGVVYLGGCLTCHPQLSDNVARLPPTSAQQNRGQQDRQESNAVAASTNCAALRRHHAKAILAVIAILMSIIITLSIVLSNEKSTDKVTPSASGVLLDASTPSPSPGVLAAPPQTGVTVQSTPTPMPAPSAVEQAKSTLSPSFGIHSTLPPSLSPTQSTSPPVGQEAQLMDLCDFDWTLSRTGLSQGLWFQAPTDFCIVGLRVPNEANQATQNVEAFLLDSPPPEWPTTASGGSVFYAAGEPTAGDHIVEPDPKIDVPAGKYVGLLGTAGDATMHNSYCAYGTGSSFESTIDGYEVTLNSFGTGNNIASSPAPNYYWSYNPWRIGRVEMYYVPGGCGA